MLTKEQFELWCIKNQITEPTKAYIQRIREQEPVRRVKSFNNNVTGFYSSTKMGLTIQFESHTLELRAIYEFEHDPDVLEYYDQTKPIKLKYRDKNGKNISHSHTADYFIIRRESVGYEECKPHEKLLEGSEKYIGRYETDTSGNWVSPQEKKPWHRLDCTIKLITT
ncbi:Tn7 transposase TnsA N-terminal domain-containing protein [Paenibacillus sp. CC-CFT747]|nr:Tn7 transposase TnsA N-terminal domain-containing protein [Paenibacillus sp. CC-CFT747]